jgi:hypothetical protein
MWSCIVFFPFPSSIYDVIYWVFFSTISDLAILKSREDTYELDDFLYYEILAKIVLQDIEDDDGGGSTQGRE